MLRNLVRNVLSGIISGVINGSSGGNVPPPLNERYFTQLDGQSKYWRRIEPDYGQTTAATLECLFYGGASGFEYLVGRSSDRFYLGLSNNNVTCGNGGSTNIGNTAIDPTKINHAKLTADGTSVTFFVNGVQVAQVAQLWTGLLDDVQFGGSNSGTNSYSGILVSARVTTDTVDNIYGLDTNLPYDLPNGEALGSELWDGTPAIDGGWTDNGGGSFTCDGSSNSALTQSIPAGLTQGDEVEITFEISGYVSGGLRGLVYCDDGYGVGIAQTADGVYSQIVSLSNTGGSITDAVRLQSYTAFIGTVSNISFKEIPTSALIFENGSIDGSDRLLVTERQDNSGFLGEDLWPDGVKAIAGNATTTGINSISINETGTALAAVGIAAPAVPVTLSGFANLATGQVDISVIPAFAGVVVSITQSGAFSFDLESQGAINFKRSFANGAQATITNIKVEPTYDYAAGATPPVDSYSDSYTDSYE